MRLGDIVEKKGLKDVEVPLNIITRCGKSFRRYKIILEKLLVSYPF